MALTGVEMLAVVAALTRRNFYKSLTTYADHRIWQDVYHAPTPVGKEAYIKVTMRDTAPVIQFNAEIVDRVLDHRTRDNEIAYLRKLWRSRPGTISEPDYSGIASRSFDRRERPCRMALFLLR